MTACDGILSRTISVVARLLERKPEEIQPDATLLDLGMDSLDAVELAFMVEEEFGLELLDDEEVEKLLTVRQIAEYVEKDRQRQMDADAAFAILKASS